MSWNFDQDDLRKCSDFRISIGISILLDIVILGLIFIAISLAGIFFSNIVPRFGTEGLQAHLFFWCWFLFPIILSAIMDGYIWHRMWLVKEYEKNDDTIRLWVNDVEFSFDIDSVTHMFRSLEVITTMCVYELRLQTDDDNPDEEEPTNRFILNLAGLTRSRRVALIKTLQSGRNCSVTRPRLLPARSASEEE